MATFHNLSFWGKMCSIMGKYASSVMVFKSIGPVGADLSKQRDDWRRIKPKGNFNYKEKKKKKLHVGRKKDKKKKHKQINGEV